MIKHVPLHKFNLKQRTSASKSVCWVFLSVYCTVFMLGCATSGYLAYSKSSRQYDPNALSEELKSKNKHIRKVATINARNLGREEHIEPLINMALTDPDIQIRGCALGSLSHIFNRTKDRRIIEFFMQECQKVFEIPHVTGNLYKSKYMRTNLLCALWNINMEASEVIDCVIKFMADEEEILDREEILSARQLGLPLPDTNTNRAQAIKCVAWFGERDIQPLIKAVHSENPKIRSGVIEALVRLGDKAIDPLIAELNSEDIRIKTAAIEALGEIGNAKAIEPLTALLTDEREDIRKRTAVAIGKIRLLSEVKM